MKKPSKSQHRFIRRVQDEHRKHYRTITGEGDNAYTIKIVKPHLVKASTDISIEKCVWTEWNWTYRDAHFNISISRQNALPLVCDGILNLTSKKFSQHFVDVTEKGKVKQLAITVYKATWLAQGRGTQISIEKGFIAKCGKEYYHATTSDSAIRSIILKRSHAEKQRTKKKLAHSEYLQSIPENLMLSYQDSLAVGNCAKGTRNFINRHSLSSRRKYSAKLIFRLARGTAHEGNVRRVIDNKITPIVNEPYVQEKTGTPLPKFKKGSILGSIKGWFVRKARHPYA